MSDDFLLLFPPLFPGLSLSLSLSSIILGLFHSLSPSPLTFSLYLGHFSLHLKEVGIITITYFFPKESFAHAISTSQHKPVLFASNSNLSPLTSPLLSPQSPQVAIRRTPFSRLANHSASPLPGNRFSSHTRQTAATLSLCLT